MGDKGKSGIIVVVALLVVATALAIWMRQREFNPTRLIEAGTAMVTGVTAKSADDIDAIDQPTPNPSLAEAPSPKTTADPEFQKWISDEAKELDNLNVDGAAKKRQIRAVVSKMTSQQSKQLLQTVKNPRSPAAEKILSTFLLVEGGTRTQKELSDLISSPLLEDPNYKPHTEEEMKGIREKSLRIMAIDGLFSQAQHEPSAREALARAARETQDPSIRAYAEDKLRQLQ